MKEKTQSKHRIKSSSDSSSKIDQRIELTILIKAKDLSIPELSVAYKRPENKKNYRATQTWPNNSCRSDNVGRSSVSA